MDDQQVIHALGIDDAYRVERTLASGPGGVTELVSLDGSGPFVRKRIPAKLARRGVWATLAECGCARLPHVAAAYEMPDEFVVVCDFVPGESLEQLVASRGRLAEKDALPIALQLCEAVGALHAHGIVHRDISPTNVIVAADGAHLIDFGIARFRVEGATRDTTQLGTYGFASPEQYGFAQTDARSDVYSIARILGYLLTGASPADAERYEAALADPCLVRPELAGIIRRASSMEPSVRHQSADELACALRGEEVAAVEAGAPPLPSETVAEAAGRRAGAGRRRGRLKGLLAAMAVISFAAAVVVVLSQTGVIGGTGAGAGDAPVAEDVREPADDAAPNQGETSSGDAGATGAAPQTAPSENPLEIVESGWSVDSQGYVHYAFGLKNTGDVPVKLPGVTITGRDGSGGVVFSEDQILNLVPAGQTVYHGFLAGNGAAIAAVEFTPMEPESYNLGSTSDAAPRLEVSGTNAVSGDLGMTSFVGDVRLVDDGGYDGGMLAVTVVLRDESGAIIYGDTTFPDRPAVGQSTSFEITCWDVPDYATYEIHAQLW